LAALPLASGDKFPASAPVHRVMAASAMDKLIRDKKAICRDAFHSAKKTAPEGAESYLPLGDNSDELVSHARNKFPWFHKKPLNR